MVQISGRRVCLAIEYGLDVIQSQVIKFKRSNQQPEMNITPRIKSTRNHKHLIVNVSIEIPIKNKNNHNSLSPSPNQRKKSKLMQTLNQDRKTTYQTNLNTLRDMPYMQTEMYPSQQPSRKKQTAPTPLTSARGLPTKYKSTELSPKRKSSSRKSKQSRIVRNISILQQVANDEDNIIKYTTNSNELKERLESIKNISEKVETHMSQVDISEIRQIELKYKEGKESQMHMIATDFLKIACAKKIQRAWRKYRTKKLIRSYSNDIRKKNLKKIQSIQQLAIKTTRSQGVGMKLKMKNIKQPQLQAQTERSFSKMTKFQEESIEKWQEMLQRIRNQKNIDKLLEISIERTKELKHQIGIQANKEKADFFQEKEQTPIREKIVKTKGYYEQQRQKRKQSCERSIGSIKREERVKYFENQMLKIENDLSQISSESRVTSLQGQNLRQLEQIQNLKLRKKLQIFKQHLPQIHPFNSEATPEPQHHTVNASNSKRIDIATILKKKTEQTISSEIPKTLQEYVPLVPTIVRKQEKLQLGLRQQQVKEKPSIVQDELSSIETYRDWTPIGLDEQEEQNKKWKQRLNISLKTTEQQILSSILEELVLQSLIQISQSQKLIQYIKKIYDQVKKKAKKPEGIVTSHASIKDYLNYFINYLYQYKYDSILQNNLLKPIGPSATDVLKYFRGEELPYDPDSEYVMNIKIFNEHWKYANQFIYFDPKWQDPQKQTERVTYLKQLTKVFFRCIFDCFNESLEHQRMFGMRGRPYPWSFKRLHYDIPTLKQSLLQSFQRVIKMSTVFSGVLFQDKQHNLDRRTMQQIQQQNMVKLILIETEEDETLWSFYEDELVEIKLECCKYIEQKIVMEVVKVLASKLIINP